MKVKEYKKTVKIWYCKEIWFFVPIQQVNKATEKIEKICLGSALYWTDKKFVYNQQQCFAFQI